MPTPATPAVTHSTVGSGYISTTDGTYTIQQLPAGTYYLYAYTWNSSLSPEWWDESGLSTPDCSGADALPVAMGATVTNKNFQLDPPSDLSGTVTDSAGNPVTSGGYVYVYRGDPCGEHTWVKSGSISGDGTYMITALPAGTYYLYAYAWYGNLTPEWWADPASEWDCTSAQQVVVAGGVPVTDKDFQLDLPTTLSGTVTDSVGGTVTSGSVYLYSGDPCGAHSSHGSDSLNADGTYTISNLRSGHYFVFANPSASTLAPEWWADPSSTPYCAQAEPVTVSDGAAVEDIDFQLDPAAQIFGTVFESDGSTGITGNGYVYAYTGADPCGSLMYVGDGYISSDGTYTIAGLPAGNIYLFAVPGGNYLDEWWADPASSPSCADAEPVVVATPGETVTGRNFQLDAGAQITGTVYEYNGTGTAPVSDPGYVEIYTGPCGSGDSAGYGYFSAADGTYAVQGLPAGTYYLYAYTWSGNQITEWWAAGGSVLDCNDAEPVTVAAGGTAPATDFQLDLSARISGTVYDNLGNPVSGNGYVYAYTGADPCGSLTSVSDGYINADGTYTILRLPAGAYYLYAYPYSGDRMTEWWADPASNPDCSQAQPVTAAVGQILTGYDFQLDGTDYQVTATASPSAGGTVSGGGWYNEGDTATLTATPAAGYFFSNWSGDAGGTDIPLSVLVDSDKEITANFTRITHTVTTAANPPEGGTVDGGGTYNWGDTASLTAIPVPGYVFSDWSGDATGTDNPLSVLVDSDKSITANFTRITHTVTTAANPPEGGTVDGGGTYNWGDTTTLTATPAANYEFSGWSGDARGTDNPLSVLVDSDKSITANFTWITHTVTTAANPPEGGTVDGGGTYNLGDTATLTANPAAGYVFSGWSGDGGGTENPLSVLVDSDKSITANFTRITHTVTTTVDPPEGGTVEGGGTYNWGDTATLTATPAEGYVFSGWSGDAGGTDNPLSVTVDSDKSITANFAKKEKGKMTFPIRARDGQIVIISL